MQMNLCPYQHNWPLMLLNYPFSVHPIHLFSILVRRKFSFLLSSFITCWFVDDPSTFSQVLTLYNPYDFVVRYKGKDYFFLLNYLSVDVCFSVMHSSKEIFNCRTTRRNSCTTFRGYVWTFVR
jgi:hypothetical protein